MEGSTTPHRTSRLACRQAPWPPGPEQAHAPCRFKHTALIVLLQPYRAAWGYFHGYMRVGHRKVHYCLRELGRFIRAVMRPKD